MSISSSIKNLSRTTLLANYPAKDFLTSAQKWRSYTGARSPHQFIETRNPKTSRSFYIPSPPSRSFSTSSNESNSISKTGFIGWYLRKLESRPIATKTITTSLIYAAADLTAQTVLIARLIYEPRKFYKEKRKVDGCYCSSCVRTLRMAGFGLLFLGPSQHLWFNFMSKILPKRDIGTTFKKMFMGQALYGPANCIIFFSYNAGLQGESGDEILARLKRDLLPTLRTGLLFWPMCDFATYRFVPVHLQPLVNSTCAYFWTTYLTYMASLEKVSIDS